MDPKKTAILDALAAFMRQRPGLEFANYGDVASYRAESRSITRDLHQAETLLAAVRWRDGITADMLMEAARSAYSGRLTLRQLVQCTGCRAYVTAGAERCKRCDQTDIQATGAPLFSVDYCTGQYFPTEYRRAVCAVLASALWYYTREHCMPPPITEPNGERTYQPTNGKPVSAGDWLRAHFKREFGRTIAKRWFQ